MDILTYSNWFDCIYCLYYVRSLLLYFLYVMKNSLLCHFVRCLFYRIMNRLTAFMFGISVIFCLLEFFCSLIIDDYLLISFPIFFHFHSVLLNFSFLFLRFIYQIFWIFYWKYFGLIYFRVLNHLMDFNIRDLIFNQLIFLFF